MSDAEPDKIAASVRQNAARVVDRIKDLTASDTRQLVSIAGPPGSGKSTLAAMVVAELLARGQDAALMPMDGFHLDNRLLEPRGLLPYKGAPETFDFGGFLSALRRVRTEVSVILPVFDRSREIAIAGAEEIRSDNRIVIVEGNYLCLDEDPWRGLSALWDFSVFLDIPLAELERRLIDRWLSYGYDHQTAVAKVRSNDLVNADRVKNAVGSVDLMIT